MKILITFLVLLFGCSENKKVNENSNKDPIDVISSNSSDSWQSPALIEETLNAIKSISYDMDTQSIGPSPPSYGQVQSNIFSGILE